MVDCPAAGVHYPGSLPQLRRWFGSDEDCLDYLDWLRWPDGFICPHCGGVPGWAAQSWPVHRCGHCGRRTSVTAGTVFHTTRTPLTVWFEAAWLMMTSKQGVSALELQRVTEVGSYQTAWTILHKLRLATSSTGREALTGRVEVDEALFGGLSPGFSGRSLEKKALVAAAIERRGTRRFGRARLQVIPDASAASLTDFLRTAVTAGSTIITDGWRSYPDTAARLHLIHEAHKIGPSGEPAHVALPGVHRLFSLSKRVLEGTYQGGVQQEHLQAYLDEYIFRFNRRTAKHRGLLFLRLLEHAVGAIPTRYRDLVAIHREMTSEHRPIARTHSHPTTLTGDHIDRPWRAA